MLFDRGLGVCHGIRFRDDLTRNCTSTDDSYFPLSVAHLLLALDVPPYCSRKNRSIHRPGYSQRMTEEKPSDNTASVKFDNPTQTVARMTALLPDLKTFLKELPGDEFSDIERTISFVGGAASLYERILLLCGGTFALTLNLIAPASAQLDKHGSHLSVVDHLLLYSGWICLTVAVFSAGILWLKKQSQATILGVRAIMGSRAIRTTKTLNILSRMANAFDGIHFQSPKEDGRSEEIDVSSTVEQLVKVYSAHSAKVNEVLGKSEEALKDKDPEFNVKMTAFFSRTALITVLAICSFSSSL